MMKSRMQTCDRAPQAWTKQARTKQIRRVALGSALALLGLASFAAGARAEDNGLFGTIAKSLGIGSDAPIEYRERPPLVVPQTHDLPPPQSSARARDPNWPADPKSGARAARSDQLQDLDRLAVPQRPAQPAPLAGGPAAGGPETTATVPASPPAEQPGMFQRLFSSSDTKGAVPTTAPSRKTLVQPPADYEETARPATPEKSQPGQPGASGL